MNGEVNDPIGFPIGNTARPPSDDDNRDSPPHLDYDAADSPNFSDDDDDLWNSFTNVKFRTHCDNLQINGVAFYKYEAECQGEPFRYFIPQRAQRGDRLGRGANIISAYVRDKEYQKKGLDGAVCFWIVATEEGIPGYLVTPNNICSQKWICFSPEF